MSPDEPRDPQRAPWSHAGRARADYRMQLQGLDQQLVEVGRLVVELAGPVAAVHAPVAPGALDRAHQQFEDLQQQAVVLEDRAFTLVALESPVAEDLREVVALIRATHNVVRSGRLAEHLVEQLTILEDCGVSTVDGPLASMRANSTRLFIDAVGAWAQRDALAYNDLKVRDHVVDDLRDRLLATVPDCRQSRCAAAHVLAVRFLERYADHGVALCGHLAWAVTGDRVLGQHVDPG